MARLEYDESGSTFYYFLLSFYGIILLPITYLLWPRREDEEEAKRLVCQCEPCRRKKTKLDVDHPKKRYKRIARVVALVVLWSFFAVMLYKVVTLERDYVEYDPFEILELEAGAPVSEIRRQYRRLSKVYHPDKEGGDQEKFMRIAKAYEALTDEESKRNWEEYGNPDGPKAAVFGIALPSWIVEKSNSIWILGLYLAVFIIGLPVIVGVWWYKSSQYGHTNVFLNTSRLFWMLLAKSKITTVKQIVMILTAAQEFSPHQSKMAKERPSDDTELSELIRTKMLPHVDIKNKKVPFSIPYAAKARILVHAHLERVELPESTLEIDQCTILKTCPQLLDEMMNIVTGIWVNAQQQPRKGFPVPSLEVFESVMQVSQMIIQGMWPRTSPLLQLPHLHPTHLKHFRTKKRSINTLEQFVNMKEKERRALVRTLSEEGYLDIMAICAMFPHVDIHAETKVVGDEDHHRITAGSVVTLVVTLRREGLLDHYGVSVDSILGNSVDEKSSGPPLEDGPVELEPETIGGTETPTKKAVWSKQQKKKKKGKQPTVRRRKPVPAKGGRKPDVEREETAKTQGDGSRERGEGGVSDSEVEDISSNRQINTNKNDEESDRGSVHDEDEEWRSLQEGAKNKRWYEKTNRESFPVHAPFFPEVKQECWWLYVVEKRKKRMIVPPRRVVGLRDEQSVDLKFVAPPCKGSVRYTVILMSDSYLDLSFQRELKLQVHEREEVHDVAQWRDLEEEEEEEEMIEESESEGETSERESMTDQSD